MRHASKFVMESKIPDDQIQGCDIILRREHYGAPGTAEHRKNAILATTPLTEKFGVPRHKVISRASGRQEGDQVNFQHIQKQVVGVLHRVTDAKHHAVAMDFGEITNLPHLNRRALAAGKPLPEIWDDSETNIFDAWDKFTLDEIKLFQLCINKWFSAENRTASSWLQIFVFKSSTDSLRTAVAKKYDKLDKTCKGGLTYLYLTLCAMFQMNKDVKQAMLNFLDLFKKQGLARYTNGENVEQASEELIGVCHRLDAVNALTDEHVVDICTGMGICQNDRFRGIFKLLAQKADIGESNLLPDCAPTDSPLDQIEAILNLACDKYDALSTANKWNVSAKGGRNTMAGALTGKLKCWNCEKEGCTVSKCDQPKNQAKIDKNKKAFMENKKKKSEDKTKSNPGTNGGSGGGDYQRKKWSAGMLEQNGVLMVNCKVCGPNLTHTTG